MATPRPRSTRLLIVVLVSLSLATITLDYREGPSGPLAGTGRAVRSALAPLQSAVTTVTRPIGNFFAGLAHLPSLEQKNRDLQEQIDNLNTQIALSAEQQRQLQALQELLGLKQTLDPEAVPAVVIANGVSNFEWTVTINKGSDDHIAVDMPVVTGDATAPRLVGHIVAVTAHSADVQLIIDPNGAVAGVLGTSQEPGLVRGEGAGDMRMDLISPDTQIDLSEGPVEVFTMSYQVAGEHGLYPPGILVGGAWRVFQGSNQLQTSVSVRPAVNFSSLEYVLVLRLQPKGTS